MDSHDQRNMKMAPGYSFRHWLTIACISAALVISGCASQDMGDLKKYIKKINAKKSRKIDPLPEIKVPEVYFYQSSEAIDPFMPFVQEEPDVVSNPELDKKIAEQMQRVREELEYFPLDTLRMVGTIERDSNIWGLITDPQGAVHRVQLGNYMGKNYGKVILVTEDHLELLEIVPDNQGGWVERPARVDLSE